MRNTLAIAIVLTLTVASANATNFWLSRSNTSSAPPGDVAAIPTLPPSGKAYVWGRPDAGKTLLNWDLNIHTSSPGVISFTRVNVLNPLLGQITVPRPLPVTLPLKRYEFINDSSVSPNVVAPDGQSVLFAGFSVANTNTVGAGIGPQTTVPPFMDPNYDSSNDSWLMAEITYEAIGTGMTDLFLQIGVHGLNHQNEASDQVDVILGALTDPPLNGFSGRNMDSATPEARTIVPEPSSFMLLAIGVLSLCASARSIGQRGSDPMPLRFFSVCWC
jgi:hypothetical protein